MSEPKFPSPQRIRGRRLYPLSKILDYERALAGQPALEHDPANERWLTSSQVRERFGGVSDMWLWRRAREAEAA